MAIQPVHHWQFNEREGDTATDSIGGVKAKLIGTSLQSHGRIGNAVRVHDRPSHIHLGDTVGQFGDRDFTLAFGMNILDTRNRNLLDIIGNRATRGHGNWVSLRLQDKQRLVFEVAEDKVGKNHIRARTDKLIKGSQWFHIALVREATTLRIYVDGILQAEASLSSEEIDLRHPSAGRPGVANISNEAGLRLGHYREETPKALYEDLRIYHRALNAVQIENLIPPPNRLLRSGQIELVAAGGAAVILKEDINDLNRFSSHFEKLRLGPDTGVTLYRGANFSSVEQKLTTGIPEIKLTKIGAPPRSVRIWPTTGEPFTGKWIIAAPNGQFLSCNNHILATAPDHGDNELFTFHFNPNVNQPQLIPVSNNQLASMKVGNETSVLLVDDSETRNEAFSIVHPTRDQWLQLAPNDQFGWTQQHEDRAIFHRVAKIADNEGQVGELSAGEVALYEHQGYRGRTWVLSDSHPADRGNFASLRSFKGLDNRITSLSLGPNTGVTVFANDDQNVNEARRETEVEDFVDDIPDLRFGKAQIGNDTISSLKIFRTVSPDAIFTGVSSKLSQDYRMIGDQLEEFSAYRTILRFTPEVSDIEVSATDLTTIEVEGVLHEIDEVRSVTLSPNGLRQIMITSEADGLSTPALKFRTSNMAENERVVIFPDREAHQQIATLEEGALWKAKDARGNHIVDRNAHTQSEVASVQNTVKRVMATVAYPDDSANASRVNSNASVVKANISGRSRSGSSSLTNQMVSGESLGDPWTINFTPRSAAAAGGQPGQASLTVASDAIWEQPLSQQDFAQRLGQVVEGGSASRTPGAGLRAGGFFGNLGEAIKGAVSVSIGFANNVVNAIVDIGGKLVRFILDTAKRVAEFVQAVVEKVVEKIKQFIEFLQFIFDWDDILATQSYLKNAINSAFDSVGDMVVSARKPVSDFINNLQEDIKDGVDNMIRSLGVDPSEDDDNDGFELPEAAEWLLNKIFGGSKDSDNAGATGSGSTAVGSGQQGSFETALERFLAAIKDIGGVAAEIFEGIIETVEALIKNPLRPELVLAEILEAFKEVSLKALDFAENFALGMFDLVVAVIELLKDLLNAEIRIPLISNLFELLGAGQLSFINLISLLVAVPATVLSKLIFGETPFKQLAAPAMPKQQDSTRKVSLRAAKDTEVAANNPRSESVSDAEEQRSKVIGWGVTAIAADGLNGIITTFLDLIPEPDGPADFTTDENFVVKTMEISSLTLSFVSWLASFPSSEQEAGGYPYNVLAPENAAIRAENRQMFRERILWNYRTFVLGIEIAYLGTALIADGIGKSLPLTSERLKRADEGTTTLSALFSLGDLTLACIYLAGEEDRGPKIASEVIAALPGIFAPLRLVPSSAPHARAAAYLVLAGMNGAATILNIGFGIKFLIEDVSALERTIALQQLPQSA